MVHLMVLPVKQLFGVHLKLLSGTYTVIEVQHLSEANVKMILVTITFPDVGGIDTFSLPSPPRNCQAALPWGSFWAASCWWSPTTYKGKTLCSIAERPFLLDWPKGVGRPKR
mmetsp:Transcript_90864/g.266034  ORF Transcript_90864/g.266034 Transcript_90864/m.266034 type:complete len:112 (+) Transcript_90864:537-872(+)